MEYKFVALDSNGKKINSKINATSEADLYLKLFKQDLHLVKATPISSDIFASNKIKLKDLVIFSKQMAAMLQSGISLLDAISIVYTKGTNKNLKLFYLDLYEKLQTGDQLSKILLESKYRIPPFYTYLIQAGEISGKLDVVFEQLATHYEKEIKIKGNITQAMMYPLMLLGIAVVVVISLMVFLLPNFFSQFEGIKLPWTTRVLMQMSNSLIDYWYLHIITVFILIVGFKQLLKLEKFRYWFDKIIFKLPIIQKYMRVVITTKFTRTFALLYSSGVSILDSIKIIKEIFSNRYLDELFEVAQYELTQGETISSVFANMQVFEPLMNSMMYVGEESGRIDQTLSTTAEFFDMELEQATKRLLTILEPLLILFLAIIVLFIIISVLVPIYGVYSNIS